MLFVRFLQSFRPLCITSLPLSCHCRLDLCHQASDLCTQLWQWISWMFWARSYEGKIADCWNDGNKVQARYEHNYPAPCGWFFCQLPSAHNKLSFWWCLAQSSYASQWVWLSQMCTLSRPDTHIQSHNATLLIVHLPHCCHAVSPSPHSAREPLGRAALPQTTELMGLDVTAQQLQLCKKKIWAIELELQPKYIFFKLRYEIIKIYLAYKCLSHTGCVLKL